MLKGSFKGKTRTLNCIVSRQCGGRCLAKDQECRIDDAQTIKLATSLIGKAKSYVGKVNLKRIQYITMGEARLFRAVVDRPNSLASMAAGDRIHPLIRINNGVTDRLVESTYKKILASKNRDLIARVRSAGIRKQNGIDAPSKDDQAKLLIKAFLRQGGRDFYTGKRLNLFTAVIDHLQPLSKGGTNDFGNLVLTSSNINYYKRAFSQEELKSKLRIKTESLDPAFGNQMRKALATFNTKRVQELKKASTPALRKLEQIHDREQAKALKTLKNTKEELAAPFKNGGWMLYNNAAAVQNLSPKALKELLREQDKTGGAGYFKWFRTPGAKGLQVSLPKTNSARATALINAGAPRASIPEPWLKELRADIARNANPAGGLKLKNALGPEYKDFFEQSSTP